VIVDAEDHDLTGWSVEVGKDEEWMKRALGADWTPERATKTSIREFTSQQPWYRSRKGSPWDYPRFSKDQFDHPWSALVDHGEGTIRWLPPDHDGR
jgi:hypothetical protein